MRTILQNWVSTTGKPSRNIVFAIATIAVVGMVLAISINGFFTGDDYAMRMGNDHSRPERVSTIGQAIQGTAHFYKTWGGGLFSAFFQFVFCGVFGDNKLWFDLFNGLMVVFTIVICAGFVDGKGLRWGNVALFSLLSWFLLPQPHETLFWVTGSRV